MSSKQAAHNATIGKIHSGILKNIRIDMYTKIKTPKQLERHLKGVANHHRIRILFLIAKREDITLTK